MRSGQKCSAFHEHMTDIFGNNSLGHKTQISTVLDIKAAAAESAPKFANKFGTFGNKQPFAVAAFFESERMNELYFVFTKHLSAPKFIVSAKLRI